MTYQQLIKKWRISHAAISKHMNMPLGTFKTKLSENQAQYRFTADETKALLKAIERLKKDIEKI